MGFDINGFKNAFFSAMRNAGNIETKDSQINTEKEVKEAKNIQSAFKNQLANISDPIGDSFIKSNKTQAKGGFYEVSVDDLMALLDDKKLNIDDVKKFTNEKHVSAETTSALANLGKVETSKEIEEMTKISDADTNVLRALIDTAFATDSATRISEQADLFNEVAAVLETPEHIDAFFAVVNKNDIA